MPFNPDSDWTQSRFQKGDGIWDRQSGSANGSACPVIGACAANIHKKVEREGDARGDSGVSAASRSIKALAKEREPVEEFLEQMMAEHKAAEEQATKVAIR